MSHWEVDDFWRIWPDFIKFHVQIWRDGMLTYSMKQCMRSSWVARHSHFLENFLLIFHKVQKPVSVGVAFNLLVSGKLTPEKTFYCQSFRGVFRTLSNVSGGYFLHMYWTVNNFCKETLQRFKDFVMVQDVWYGSKYVSVLWLTDVWSFFLLLKSLEFSLNFSKFFCCYRGLINTCYSIRWAKIKMKT